MASIPDIRLVAEDGWVNLHTLCGLPAGTALSIQNKSTSDCFIFISATEPTVSVQDGYVVSDDSRVPVYIPAGMAGVWIAGVGPIHVQDATFL